MNRPSAVIVGLAGVELTPRELHLLRDRQPLGIILFQRNVVDVAQVRNLTATIRDCLGRDDAPILVDQEGGRVARLRPPAWRDYPAARRVGAIAERDPVRGEALAYALAARIALDLAAVGIDWVCAPVLDLLWPAAHAVIGDRAYGGSPELVARLGAQAVRGFLDGGVVPIVKHAPGHGRASADSHVALPEVTASLDELRASDFVPFRALATAPAAMTAHVRFTALDATRPLSTSACGIERWIRGELGFCGFLLSDDVDMHALDGSVAHRVRAVLDAGHDAALQCNGRLDDAARALDVAGVLSMGALMRLGAATRRRGSGAGLDADALDAELRAAGL